MDDHTAINLSVQTLLDERHSMQPSASLQPLGTGKWMGPFQGRRRGHGTEFDDLRHYYPGDDARHIDWKASARTNRLHTRLYREERDVRTTVIADLRDAMFTGSHELQAIRVCCVAARLIWQATEGGSRSSVLVVSDAGISLSDPGSGHQAAIDACSLLAKRFEDTQRRLGATSPTGLSVEMEDSNGSSSSVISLTNPENTAKTVQLDTVIDWIMQHSGKLSTVLWVSDFQQCGTDFNRNMALLESGADNMAIIVEDPLLSTGLPQGQYGFSQNPHAADADHGKLQKRFVSVGFSASEQLRTALKVAAAQRNKRFSTLQVPMLHIEEGLDTIISALRYRQYLP